MVSLSTRLKCIAGEIGRVSTFADIGTDHGKLIAYALERGIADRAFGVDISADSLLKAKLFAEQCNISDRVDFFCGDGLAPLTECPDVVVIAGMGGNEIVKIISDRNLNTRYVLMPHQDAHVLRRYLVTNGFEILKDYVIKDGKFYAIIVAKKGVSHYSETQIILGANNPQTKEFEERLLARRAAIEAILKRTTLDQLQTEIRTEYEEICKWLSQM